jgi:cytochrome c-type biogenesis protein CcmF
VRRNQQRWGGALIHFGFVFLVVGLAGNWFGQEYNLTLTPGRPANAGDYQLLYKGPHTEQKANATLRGAQIEVYRNGALVDTMLPARKFYPTQPEPLTEVAIHRTVREDLYLVLASENPGGTVTIRALINPLVMVAWFAFPLFTLGTAIAIFYKPRRLVEPATEEERLSYA